MLRWRKRIRKVTYLLTDLVCFIVAFILGEVVYVDSTSNELALSGFERLSFLMIFMLTLVMLYLIFNIYVTVQSPLIQK